MNNRRIQVKPISKALLHIKPIETSVPLAILWKQMKEMGVTLWYKLLYNWLIWRVLMLAVFFKEVFYLYLFWRLEQSEQRHLYVDIFLCDL